MVRCVVLFKSKPILLQRAEFDFNCLEDALVKEEWHTIKVSESSLHALMRNNPGLGLY